MRKFSARETEWLQELDGIELADFWQRALAFLLDWLLVVVVLSAVTTASIYGWLQIQRLRGKPDSDVNVVVGRQTERDIQVNGTKLHVIKIDNEDSTAGKAVKLANDLFVPILYFGIFTWRGQGRTPGKRLLKIRVVSIAHRHLSFWHSAERALGYGAAALEGGFGFVQFFLHPYRRCAQDRLAETIVVKERSYQALQHRLSHPLVPNGEDVPEET